MAAIFKHIFLNGNQYILNQMSLKIVPSDPIVPFHKDFSPSGEQLEHRKLAHKL